MFFKLDERPKAASQGSTAALLLAGSAAAAEFRVGSNLAEVTDWSSGLPFLDAFKMARK